MQRPAHDTTPADDRQAGPAAGGASAVRQGAGFERPALKLVLACGLLLAAFVLVALRSYEIGRAAFRQGLDRPARILFLLSATLGDPRAQNNLAGMYAQGRGGRRCDACAAHWFEQAAKAGIVQALFNLANFYEEGLGVPRNTPRAVALFRQAAEQGDVLASFNLGVIHASERDDLAADYAQATQWYRRAADANYASAQYNLGSLYATGKNGPQDFVQAQAWYEKAAAQNHPKALLDLGTIEAFGLAGPGNLQRGLQLLGRAAGRAETADAARERMEQACARAGRTGVSVPPCPGG